MGIFKKLMGRFEKVDPNENRNTLSALLNTPDETEYFRRRDIRDNANAATLAYLPFFGLLSLFQAKRSPFVRYHMNQGLILFIVEIVWWIVELLLSKLFNHFLLYFLTFLLALFNLVILYLIAKGMKNASKGIARELPLIGHFQILP